MVAAAAAAADVSSQGGGAGPAGADPAPRRELPLLPQFALQVRERLEEGVLELQEAGDFMLELLKEME